MADKIHLVSILLEHLAGFSDRVDLPIQIVHDPLGRPQLLLGECDGPSISFSECQGKIWATLRTDSSDIGIDAAAIDEFPQEYPFGRVFHVQEHQHALRLTGGDLKKASALLWSIKEATVKALGGAFHLVDPLQICVSLSNPEKDGGHTSKVCLSEKTMVRFPMADRRIFVRSVFQENTWLSIAVLTPPDLRENSRLEEKI